jgi:hypothetical protein
MIIARMAGGLGNQMFQYATARCLAHRLGADLALDTSFSDKRVAEVTPRKYELANFTIDVREATPREVADLTGRYETPLLRLSTFLRQSLGLRRYSANVFREVGSRFCPEVFNVRKPVYLMGYWQSEKYFLEISDLIRRDFTVSLPLDEQDHYIAKMIDEGESVSVHFRRSDYVYDQKTAAYHGVPPMTYYFQALELIQSRVKNPHLFIFSDEPDWVRAHVEFPVPATIVAHNSPDQGHRDLRLMSLCRHAIIANSSFSWWGAWLMANPDKVVVAPQRWFADPTKKNLDLIPESWLQIPDVCTK